MPGKEVSRMNPPINHENLRDVLIAAAIAMGLTWVVATFRGCVADTTPTLASLAAQIIPLQKIPRNRAVRTQQPLIPSNF
jgi:hypothetical protein